MSETEQASDVAAPGDNSTANNGIMTHVGYETMVKQLEKLKPGSQDEVKEKLDIERGNLPIQPIVEEETEKKEKVVRSSKAAANEGDVGGDTEPEDEEEDNLPSVTMVQEISESAGPFSKDIIDSPGIYLPQDPPLATYLHQIASPDPNTVLLALQQVIEFLQSHKSNYENEFIRAIVTQLKHLRNQDPVQDPQVAKIYGSILAAIDAFYHNKNFGLEVPVENLKDIVDQLIHVLVDGRLENCPNGYAYIRVIRLRCVKIILEKSDHTKIICALVKLIHECIRMENLALHTDLVMECLWKVIKLMPSWGEDVDYSSVLLEVHNFLKEFPSTWWKNKPIVTPLRMVKTILHYSVEIKRGAIMLYLGKIPNPSESEIESYILKVFKTMKFEVVPPSQTRQPFSGETRAMLNIFMQQHPEVDIDALLWRFMQNVLKENEETGKSKSTRENVEKKTSELITSASSPEY